MPTRCRHASRRIRIRREASCACGAKRDRAGLLRAMARAAGVPVWQWLGGKRRDRVPVYANINRATVDRTPDGCGRAAAAAVAQGFGGVKIAPFDGVLPDALDRAETRMAIDVGVERLYAMRAAIGPSVHLMADCHWRFDLPTARAVLERWPTRGFGGSSVRCRARELARRDGRASRAGERTGTISRRASRDWVAGFRPFITLRAGRRDHADVKYAGGIAEDTDRGVRHAHGVHFSPHNPTGPVPRTRARMPQRRWMPTALSFRWASALTSTSSAVRGPRSSTARSSLTRWLRYHARRQGARRALRRGVPQGLDERLGDPPSPRIRRAGTPGSASADALRESRLTSGPAQSRTRRESPCRGLPSPRRSDRAARHRVHRRRGRRARTARSTCRSVLADWFPSGAAELRIRQHQRVVQRPSSVSAAQRGGPGEIGKQARLRLAWLTCVNAERQPMAATPAGFAASSQAVFRVAKPSVVTSCETCCPQDARAPARCRFPPGGCVPVRLPAAAAGCADARRRNCCDRTCDCLRVVAAAGQRAEIVRAHDDAVGGECRGPGRAANV